MKVFVAFITDADIDDGYVLGVYTSYTEAKKAAEYFEETSTYNEFTYISEQDVQDKFIKKSLCDQLVDILNEERIENEQIN
jgi:Rad3-related DNA helicase